MKILIKLIIICSITLLSSVSYAEQSGSSPDSGRGTSILDTAYDWLVGKGVNYGASQPADWTLNWGTYWNRIMYSAFWEPDGTAVEADVAAGKTFYSGNNNRTIRTGTATFTGYAALSTVKHEDTYDGDDTGEEATWTNTATGVWKDSRTGLYWARSQPTELSNSFATIASSDCSFFLTTPRGSYGASSTDPDCGNAINACAVLSLEAVTGQGAKTDWYLPTQKELKQAHIDGIWNVGTSLTADLYDCWSATEIGVDDSLAWRVNLVGAQNANSKSDTLVVRCVRRD